jgi:hypothetical protein
MSEILREAAAQIPAIEACGGLSTLSAVGIGLSLGKFILPQVASTDGF